MIYDNLDKTELLELLFKADTTIQALLDRDEAREALVNVRAKLADTQHALETSQARNDRLRERIKEMESLPSYHQVLEKICKELGVAGSPNIDEAIADVKKRLGRR